MNFDNLSQQDIYDLREEARDEKSSSKALGLALIICFLIGAIAICYAIHALF